MTNLYYLLNGILKPEDIRNLRYAEYSGPIAKKTLQNIEPRVTVFVHRENFKYGSFPVTGELPGNYVGVMFAFADYDFISFFNISF